MGNQTKRKTFPPQATHALQIIQSHEAVVRIIQFENIRHGGFFINFLMEVPLPSRLTQAGVSVTGVKSFEPITFLFPTSFPNSAPKIYLRKDFNRALPHIYPVTSKNNKDLISPCIYDGNLDDLLFSEGDGLAAILNHLVEWLAKAAANDLIDSSQGWEPIRRDNLPGIICFSPEKIFRYISNETKILVLPCYYSKFTSKDGDQFHICRVKDYTPISLTPKLFRNMVELGHEIEEKGVKLNSYKSFVVSIWPDSINEADKGINGYFPETITDLDGLVNRSKDYQCEEKLLDIINNINILHNDNKFAGHTFNFFINFCINRPFNLIESQSNIECISYVINGNFKKGFTLSAGASSYKIDKSSSVESLSHRHDVSIELLKQLSGITERKLNGPIIQIGCGSLGSKIVMHLARAGYGHFKLIDKGVFSPHNASRHALVDKNNWPLVHKTDLLAENLKLLDQEVFQEDIVNENIIGFLTNPSGTARNFFQEASLIIDSTGSISVRETLSNHSFQQRIIHTSIYEGGNIGFVAIEGDSRNPNLNDLAVCFWDRVIDEDDIRAQFDSRSHERQTIGMGCGSMTMVMTDSKLSMYASGMSERVHGIIQNDYPEYAEIWLGILASNGMAVKWKSYSYGPTKVIQDESKEWEVRLLTNAAKQVEKEATEWGKVETGGILFGKISLIHKSITISRVIEAPPDSKRSETTFILGTEGLKNKILDLREKSQNSLTYVGTWHSHPRGGDASSIDYDMLAKLKKLRLGEPAVCLIWTPQGYSAVVEEGKFSQ